MWMFNEVARTPKMTMPVPKVHMCLGGEEVPKGGWRGGEEIPKGGWR